LEDMMEVFPGQSIYVPGYDQLREKSPIQAMTLQAFVRFELRIGAPRKEDVLDELIKMGAKLSRKSATTVLRHINALVEANHLIREGDDEAQGRMGRGNKARPWRSRYVARTLVNGRNKQD
jgi:hypothetical protein